MGTIDLPVDAETHAKLAIYADARGIPTREAIHSLLAEAEATDVITANATEAVIERLYGDVTERLNAK